MTLNPLLIAATVAATLASTASAQVVVKDAWVRSTVAQQKATGAFMQLTSAQDAKLVAVSSTAVPVIEIHEMSMDHGVMKMREIPSLALPAGKAVELKPGGYHLMLLNLKEPMRAGESVPLTLVVEDKSGKHERIDVKVEIRAPGTATKADHAH